jgi:sulfonate transport system ATP-binding protein
MQDLVLDLWSRHRPATLLVTHDVDEAIALADRLLVLEGGRIVLDLPNPMPRPRDRGAAQFSALRMRLLDRLGVRARAA